MYWLEFDADVLSYGTPGVVVNYQSNGKEKSHTPDFQVVRYQKKQIIEVKSQKTVESEKYDRLYQMLYSRRLNIGLHEPEARRHITDFFKKSEM